MDNMRRRVPTQNLRHAEPVMLEILAGDLIEKPMGQVSPENLGDLWALAEKDDAPANLRRRLALYQQRMTSSINDLPSGPELAAVAEEWKSLPGNRVPMSLREVWVAEGNNPKRTSRDRAVVAELLARWEGVEPEPFVIAAPKAKPPPLKPGEPRPAASAQPSTPVIRKLPTAGPAKERTPAAQRVVHEEDPARRQWVREVAIDRLASSSDAGLQEMVLVAGIRHRARDQWPHLQAHDILEVLRELQKHGQLRCSAGRWTLAGVRR